MSLDLYRVGVCIRCGETKRLYKRGRVCPTCKSREQRAKRIERTLNDVRVEYPIFNKNRKPKLLENWQDYAACKGMDAAIWFPVSEKKESEVRQARKICKQCQVRQDCLAYAIMSNQKDGIWGGFTSIERDPLRKMGARWRMCQSCERIVWRESPFRETSCPECPPRDARAIR